MTVTLPWLPEGENGGWSCLSIVTAAAAAAAVAAEELDVDMGKTASALESAGAGSSSGVNWGPKFAFGLGYPKSGSSISWLHASSSRNWSPSWKGLGVGFKRGNFFGGGGGI